MLIHIYKDACNGNKKIEHFSLVLTVFTNFTVSASKERVNFVIFC